MSSHKRSLLRILIAAANGSCGCGRSKRSDASEPRPMHPVASLTSSTTAHSVDEDDGYFSTTTVSEAETEALRGWANTGKVSAKRSPIVDSVAVEKESEDPYKDFRHSMLQMIFEKEMCSESDLEELLEAFLQLNSPRHHDVIVKAFTEICQDAFPGSKSKSKEGIGCYGHVRNPALARGEAM